MTGENLQLVIRSWWFWAAIWFGALTTDLALALPVMLAWILIQDRP